MARHRVGCNDSIRKQFPSVAVMTIMSSSFFGSVTSSNSAKKQDTVDLLTTELNRLSMVDPMDNLEECRLFEIVLFPCERGIERTN